MKKILEKIINHIVERRQKKLLKTLEKMKSLSMIDNEKIHSTGDITLVIEAEEQKKLQIIQNEIRNIILQNIATPEKLLQFATEHGCKVFQFGFAKKILNLMNEEEGFIPPISGLKAFALNFLLEFFCNKSFYFSFKTKPIFVFYDKTINKHFLIQQFYKWYGFKSNLDGYDEKAQNLFKKSLYSKNDDFINKLKPNEIIALKSAIARDSEATEFTINLSKEFEGAKNALNKILNDGGAQI